MDISKTFNEYQPLLFSIAYRMLGTVMDAEDIVQEVFLRWSRASQGEIEKPRAWLSAVTTRLCIDQLRSARVKREEYIGPWLPEPLMMESPPDPTILAESLSTGFLVLLENLNPVERAVYLLREVFDYEYAEITSIVEKSEANCRQLVSRAKKYLRERRPRFEPDPEEGQRLTQQFMQTVLDGDMNGLLDMLADDIVVYSDGGGKAFAAKIPVVGAEKVARFFFGIARNVPESFEYKRALVNNLPGMVLFVNGAPQSVWAFFFDQGRLRNVYAVSNPDKLGNISDLQ
jgi:RNA polymerase sigma-70 factor (ECF subfamily)